MFEYHAAYAFPNKFLPQYNISSHDGEEGFRDVLLGWLQEKKEKEIRLCLQASKEK